MNPPEYCLNCGNELKGKYCSDCGQKRFNPSERNIASIIHHFFEEFFNWDSRILRSTKYLFLRPGLLTKEYIIGRVQNYISPMKMYIFTSLVLFFFLIKMEPDQYSSLVNTEDSDDIFSNIILNAENKSGLMKEEFAEKFNSEVNDKVAVYIFFIMVVFSVLLKLVYIYKEIYFAEHVVFTLHFFTFVLWCFLIGSLFSNDRLILFSVFIVPSVYLFIALKNVYHQKWINALVPAVFLSVSYMILIFIWILGTITISAWII